MGERDGAVLSFLTRDTATELLLLLRVSSGSRHTLLERVSNLYCKVESIARSSPSLLWLIRQSFESIAMHNILDEATAIPESSRS